MNLKKLFILMLIGIVCSVSVVSAADINDTAVEIESPDATMGVEELSNDESYIQMDDNEIDNVMTPEKLDNSNPTYKKLSDVSECIVYPYHEFDMYVPYFNSSTGCHWEVSPDSYGVEFLGQITQYGKSIFSFRVNFDDDPFYVKLNLINKIGDVTYILCEIDTVMFKFTKI